MTRVIFSNICKFYKLIILFTSNYLGINPITQRKVPYGIHYSKVKELQRVTLPGLVYASEQFAAILALKSQDYNIDHVGLMKLSDQLGSTEIYRISRKRIV